MHSIYDNVAVQKSLAPQGDTGGSPVNGGVVDTLGFNTGMLAFESGAISGSPSAISIAVKLQESDASDGSGMADALDNTGTVIGGTVTAANTELLARVEGLGANRKRYLRVVETTTFTGGTTPAVHIHANILLGRPGELPVNTNTSNT
jgi:hypothetical protein